MCCEGETESYRRASGHTVADAVPSHAHLQAAAIQPASPRRHRLRGILRRRCSTAGVRRPRCRPTRTSRCVQSFDALRIHALTSAATKTILHLLNKILHSLLFDFRHNYSSATTTMVDRRQVQNYN